jgi:hypothetical protein
MVDSRLFDPFAVAVIELIGSTISSALTVTLHCLQGPAVWPSKGGLALLFWTVSRTALVRGVLHADCDIAGREVISILCCLLSYLVIGGNLWHIVDVLIAFGELADHEHAPVHQRVVEIAISVTSTLLSCLWLRLSVLLARRASGATRAAPPSKPKVVTFRLELDTAAEPPECVICLGSLWHECEAGKLPCGHIFHDECIRTWLLEGHSLARCPMRCSIAMARQDAGSPAAEERGSEVIGAV